MAFTSMYDADKKRPARDKLIDTMERYAIKTGKQAVVALLSGEDAAAIPDPPIELRVRGYVQRHCYYVGQYEDDVIEEFAR